MAKCLVYLALGGRWLVCEYRPHNGLQARWLGEAKPGGAKSLQWSWLESRMTMKKREALGLTGVVMPGPASTSVILAKLPNVRDFLSSTAWDDGSPRVPGKMSLTANGTVWEVTLQCPSTASRMTFRGGKLDDVLTLAEQYVNAPDAPWEVDRYLAEKLAEKKPRKKT
jgi:hypothetical protein